MTMKPRVLAKRNPNIFDSIVFSYDCPQGKCFVQVIEKQGGGIFKIIVSVGKAGSQIRALCSAISELTSGLLERGTSITEVISYLSGITSSDGSRKKNGMEIYGPVDALIITLFKYRASTKDEDPESLSSHLRKVR